MAQKRSQPFRFRIPWFSSRPAAEHLPRRPKEGTESRWQSEKAVPTQRPPFKPPGKSPPQPQPQPLPQTPKQAPGAPATEPQPQSPSFTPPHRITSSLVTIESPSTSPLRSTNQIPVISSLPSPPSQSPSREGPRGSPISSPPSLESQPASGPQPPSYLASEEAREVLKPGPEGTTVPVLSPSLSSKSSQVSSVTSSPISKTLDASRPEFLSHISSEHPREIFKPTTEEKIQQPSPEESTTPALSPSSSGRQASSVTSPPNSKAQPASKPQSPSHLGSERSIEALKPATEEISQRAAISTSPLPSQASSPISKTQPHSPSHSASDQLGKEPKPTAVDGTQPSPSRGASGPWASPITSSPISTIQQPQSPSPLKPAAEESNRPALSPSPSRGGSQPLDSCKPSSPISKTSRISEALKPAVEESTQPPSPALKQKEKLELSEPVSQESKPKTNSPLKIIPESHEHTQQDTPPTQPLRILGSEEESGAKNTTEAPMETQVTAEKRESERTNGNSKSPPKTQSKSLLPSKEKEKAVQEPVKEGKTKAATVRKTIRRRTNETQAAASTSGTKAKDPATRAFQADKKQQPQPQQTVERRMMFATASLTEKDTKVVSATDTLTRSISSSSIFPQKPVLPKEEKAPLQKEIKEDISKFIEKVATSHPTESIDDIDTTFNVITLAGDNRGATMHVGLDSARKEESIPIYRAYKTDPEERMITTDGEESSDHSSVNEDEEAGRAYVNSNIQSVNNSLMFHGSVNERDPGVKLILPEKSDDNKQSPTCKSKIEVFRSESLNYQPTVRRRCLRGLFQEPSDSDPDNAEKPRRHGCKFRCGDNGKGKDAEIM